MNTFIHKKSIAYKLPLKAYQRKNAHLNSFSLFKKNEFVVNNKIVSKENL